MKKQFALLTLLSLFTIFSFQVFSQEDTAIVQEDTSTEQNTIIEEQTSSPEETVEESATFHQIIKQKFIEGGPAFMGIVLLCLILGLAIAIERIIYLNLSTTT